MLAKTRGLASAVELLYSFDSYSVMDILIHSFFLLKPPPVLLNQKNMLLSQYCVNTLPYSMMYMKMKLN